MKTIYYSARTAPSSAFGTFSPRKKPRGEKDSRFRESQVLQEGCEKCGSWVLMVFVTARIEQDDDLVRCDGPRID